MKFILALASLASFSVLAKSATSEASLSYSSPSKNIDFTEEGIHNVLKAASKEKKGDPATAILNLQDFFDRNPSIVKSIMKITNEPQYREAKNDAKAKAIELLSSVDGKYDVYSNRIKGLNYIYEHPKFLKMIQEIALKLLDEYPNGVDQFFSTFNKLVKKNPSIIHEIKKEVIDFSKDQEETYYKAFEMVIKVFTHRPRIAARIAILALEADQIACSGSKNCDCGNAEEDVESQTTEEPEADEAASIEEPVVDSEEADAEIYKPENEATEYETGNENEEPELAYSRPQ